MKWKKITGWTIFVCAILGGLYVLIPSLQHILEALSSLLEIVLSFKILALIGAGIAIWFGWNLSHRDRKRTLKIKVGGNTVKITRGAQDEDAQFLEKLDMEFSLINDVFKCLSKIDKSLYPDWEEGIVIHLQCHSICLSRKLCKKIIASMEAELTEKMQTKTRISTEGFVDYDR